MSEVIWKKIGKKFDLGAEESPYKLRFCIAGPGFGQNFFTEYDWRAHPIEAYPKRWFYLAASQYPARGFRKHVDRINHLGELAWNGLPKPERLRVQSNSELWMPNWAYWLSWVTLTLSDTEYVQNDGDWTGLAAGAFEASALAIEVFLADQDGKRAALETPEQPSAPQIEWKKRKLELRLNGELVKRYRGNMKPDRVLVLDSFQELGWQECQDNPLPIRDREERNQRTKDILKTLNANQDGVQFSSKGDSICWGCP